VNNIDRLREDRDRLQEAFIDQAITLRALRQNRRYAANDEVVMAAEQQLGETLAEWQAAIERLRKAAR
jgi:hypothetical protein